jgi:hypothetical protein
MRLQRRQRLYPDRELRRDDRVSACQRQAEPHRPHTSVAQAVVRGRQVPAGAKPESVRRAPRSSNLRPAMRQCVKGVPVREHREPGLRRDGQRQTCRNAGPDNQDDPG